ncbi:nucleotide sugar dehydrogenase [Candidatus Methylomirabilis sp.]|uniref:Nucleotide sugar dehydrogenase n=1 Tax=Candidatus Methylomirabilis tolerans TaxID=3123416 RepID=A0AAJ1ES99_9BACT|nr:nucleotide sugar dehydrogenase [Candidatus Methylomirabilis sp.]
MDSIDLLIDPIDSIRVAVIGLGYVGLPLATALAQHLPTIGFDVNPTRIQALRQGADWNGELHADTLSAPHLHLTDDPSRLREATFLIIAVPTPIDRAKRPDLGPLIEASRLVGAHLRPGAIVVYESTVYPGCTEEVCLPVLEQASGLQAGRDFTVGYSPERINPGDTVHTLDRVVKIVASQDAATTAMMAQVYGLVVKAGIYQAPDIKTAEAAKVIENIQRDLNIALMNELALLFHRLGLRTHEVLKAAGTKWNFLPFEPGLVGGHCIPVDPYYLTHKAEEVGYHPDVILAGRRINDAIGRYVARETVRLLIQAGKVIKGARVLVLGLAFKANVRDARNTRVLELIDELTQHGLDVAVTDPVVGSAEVQRLGLRDVPDPFHAGHRYDAIVLAVPHRVFQDQPVAAYLKLLHDRDGSGVLVDVKGVLREALGEVKLSYWSL